MLKKMRWKFILAAMTAVFTIVAMLSLCVNLWFYSRNIQQLDKMLHGILISEQLHLDPFNGGFPNKDFSPERPYMMRYFAVTVRPNGAVTRISRDYIASISREDAAAYAHAVMERGQDSGFYKDYRYIIDRGEINTVVFLNAEIEKSAQSALIIASCAVSAICMLVALVIILLLSKRALDPYMRNIEQQKQFITDAGHELKTPLTAIAASADVLAMEDEGNEWIVAIQAQVQRLSKLVNSMVALSRLDEERPLPEQADFSLSDVIWEVYESTRPVAQAKGKAITQSIADGLKVHGDEASIGQLVSILLDNAVKYSTAGEEIRLTAYRAHKENVIEVYNKCALPDPEHIDRLFDRFYRPDTARASSTGGNGIGLSIAKAIAEAHKGTIEAESNNGNDITFRVKLKAV